MQENQDINSVDDSSLTKQANSKKVRYVKQQEHLEKMRVIKMENVEKRKYDKKLEASKFLLEHEKKKDVKKTKQSKQVSLSESEPEEDLGDSSSSEEVIVIKKKKKVIAEKVIEPKKKPKKIKVIVQESSDDESDEESSEEEEPQPKPARKFKTQQNKKSVIKITNPIKNYFCD